MNTFIKQFTGKPFWWMIGGLVALDLVSFLTLNTRAETVLFGLAVIAILLISDQKPQWLFPIAIAEIISTSNGHGINAEFFGTSIGIRIALFAILMIATLFEILRQRKSPVPYRYQLVSLLFVIMILYGGLLGWLNNYSVRDLYLDSNGYLAIGYILSAWVWMRDSSSRRALLQAVGAGTVWIVAKTLLFLGMFGHLHPKTLDPVYKWIRDTRLGEITLQGGNIYRVFLQSQLYIVPAIIATSSYIWLAERSRETGVRVVFMLSFSAILVSMSRSFWVALVIVAIAMIASILMMGGWKKFVSRIPDLVALKVGAVALLWVIIAIPIYQSTNFSFFSDMFAGRASGVSDVAIDSRQQLLAPMWETIKEAPVVGHGLGKTVEYETSDPKYIETHETTTVKTYAFEWGWLDIWIKFGILGIFMMLWLGWLLASDLWRMTKIQPERRWLYLTLLLSLIGLFVVHIFTPYLNHPLGWGMIAIIVALIPFENKQLQEVHEAQRVSTSLKKPATVTSRTND